MREFAKVSPQFWIGETGRQIRQQGLETQLIALYLLTSPHANMIGVYYLPMLLIAHETGVSLEQTLHSLEQLSVLDFCSYDSTKEYIWVHEMAHYQIDAALKPTDNRVKHINTILQALPDLSYLPAFYQKYQTSLVLAPCQPVDNFAQEAPSKPLRSKEKEKEKEKEKKRDKEKESAKVSPFTAPTFTLPLSDNSEWPITASQISQWQQAYPDVDIVNTLYHIREWNIANPKKRKTHTGIIKHVDDWLMRQQQKQKPSHQSHSLQSSHTAHDPLVHHNRAVGQNWLAHSETLTDVPPTTESE